MEHKAAEKKFNLQTIESNKLKKKKRYLTSDQDDDASSHGDARLACFVITPTGGALHSHAGYSQPDHRHDNADDHEGSRCLKGT